MNEEKPEAPIVPEEPTEGSVKVSFEDVAEHGAEARSLEVQQHRARGMAILATMPEWWKVKFEAIARQHYGARKGRRATAKLLREYGAWLKKVADLHALQATAKQARAEFMVARIAKREAFGKGLPAGVLREHLPVDVAIQQASDHHP